MCLLLCDNTVKLSCREERNKLTDIFKQIKAVQRKSVDCEVNTARARGVKRLLTRDQWMKPVGAPRGQYYSYRKIGTSDKIFVQSWQFLSYF